MARTNSLRAQHDAVEAMIDQIFAGIEHYRSDRDAFPLTMKLARLAGTLRTHFALEEEILYPSMIASDHREAAVMARVFRTDHSQLASQFERFVDRWSRSDAIAASLRQFEYEAGMLFAALRERIDKENRELYPLAEEALALKNAALAPSLSVEALRLPA
jgi:hemerythrin-like domain-containing protein